MKVVLFGQKWLAAEVLEQLVELPDVQVLCVCPDTVPDRVADKAMGFNIPIVGLASIPVCELGIAAYCQRFLPAEIRSRCGLGVLAYHPSLLPRHRGRDAIRWTLAMREPIAGGSVYWMDDGADTGPIETQDWCHVLPGETPAELWRRVLAPMGVRLLIKCVARLAHGESPQRIPQDERVATFEPAFSSGRLRG